MEDKIIKPKFQKEEVCPNCGKSNLEYGDSDLEETQMSYEFTCPDCGAYGKEWFELSYAETVIEGMEEK